MIDNDEGTDDGLVKAVNETVIDILHDLTKVLDKVISDCNLLNGSSRVTSFKIVDYHFYHDDISYLRRGIVDENMNGQCNNAHCTVDCSPFIAKLFNQKKEYVSFLSENLVSGQFSHDVNLSSTILFGVDPIWQIVQALSGVSISNVPPTPVFEVQGGGGSGMGFQLFCSDRENGYVHGELNSLLSSGYGGGGGFYLNSESNIVSFGGGGGGGIQIQPRSTALINSSLSVGGGSGCGISNSRGYYSGRGGTSYPLYCGSDKDANNTDSQLFRKAFCSFSSNDKTPCRSFVVYGGGGGGGGTDLCCGNYHFGYGFSFTLTSDLEQRALLTHKEEVRYTKEHKRLDERILSNASEWLSNNEEDRSYYTAKYNLVGALMNDIISSGSCTEGYRDWSCLCQHAKDFIEYCLAMNGNVTKHEPITTIGTDLNRTMTYCQIIQVDSNSLGWIINSPCIFGDNQLSNNVTASDKNSLNTDQNYMYVGSTVPINTSNNRQIQTFDIYMKIHNDSYNQDIPIFYEHFIKDYEIQNSTTCIYDKSINHDKELLPTLGTSHRHHHDSSESSPLLVLIFCVFFIVVAVLFVACRIQELVWYRERLRQNNYSAIEEHGSTLELRDHHRGFMTSDEGYQLVNVVENGPGINNGYHE